MGSASSLHLLLVAGLLLGVAVQVHGKTVTVEWKEPASPQEVSIGRKGTVKLEWTGVHGVYLLEEGKCPDKFENDPAMGMTQLLAPSTVGEYEFEPKKHDVKAGSTVWLACPVGDHCKQGMLVKVVVKKPSRKPQT